MDDFLGLIVMFIFYLVAAKAGKKGKKGHKSRRNRRAERFDSQQTQEQILRRAMQQKQTERAEEAAQQPSDVKTPCHEHMRMHLHDVTQQQMQNAAEGEDPCHHGEATEAEVHSPVYEEEYGQDRQSMAQDMLRGVIMSEILTRPCERRKTYRNRRF